VSDAPFHRALRLGLHGFPHREAEDEVAQMVRGIWTPQAPWIVSNEAPVDALLLWRGTRVDDPDDAAVLRVNLHRSAPSRRDSERRLEPLFVRRPLRQSALRVALDAAFARIQRLQK
jgi:hypothetical protein